MPHVLYDPETTRTVKGKYGIGHKFFKTVGAAKAWRTRNVNKGNTKYATYEIAESGDFSRNIEKMVTRRNIMSGKEYQESINTPRCCSPASELYWSM